MYRLYVFTGSVPVVINNLVELKESLDSGVNGASILDEKFIQPLTTISNKFSMYEKLVRHVIDFDLLPDLRVNSVHDPTLHELSEEMQELQDKAENILEDARSSYASFADVKLEEDQKYGFVLRTTKADDEVYQSKPSKYTLRH